MSGTEPAFSNTKVIAGIVAILVAMGTYFAAQWAADRDSLLNTAVDVARENAQAIAGLRDTLSTEREKLRHDTTNEFARVAVELADIKARLAQIERSQEPFAIIARAIDANAAALRDSINIRNEQLRIERDGQALGRQLVDRIDQMLHRVHDARTGLKTGGGP